MSYDISIGNDSYNITYNVAPMFYKHNEKGIRFIYGMTGKESEDKIIDMLIFFIKNKFELVELNPVNMWGSWSGTVDVLYKMCISTIDYPDGTWEGN